MFYKLNLRCKKKKFDKKKDISTCQSLEYNLPLVNAKNGDNGVMYYGRFSDWESAYYCIDIVNDGAVSTGNVYPQPQATGVLYNAYLIKGIDESFHNEFVIIYIAQALQKSIKLKYGYDNKATWEKVKNNTLVLPSINDLPCTKFMESYIRELEQERIRELDAYLRATGLNDYELTPEEEKCIKFMQSGGYKEFKIGELFDIRKGKRLTKADQTSGFTPFIGSTDSNNGLTGYIGQSPIFNSPAITVNYNGSVGKSFYQEYDFWASDDVNVLYLKNHILSDLLYGYFGTVFEKSSKKYSYAFKWNLERMKESLIVIPVDLNGNIDYDFMTSFIKAIQKQCIRPVVEWKERVIETTKTMVNQIP